MEGPKTISPRKIATIRNDTSEQQKYEVAKSDNGKIIFAVR